MKRYIKKMIFPQQLYMGIYWCACVMLMISLDDAGFLSTEFAWFLGGVMGACATIIPTNKKSKVANKHTEIISNPLPAEETDILSKTCSRLIQKEPTSLRNKEDETA